VIVSQAPGADSLRTILDSVFAAPKYRWVDQPDPFAFLARWWRLLSEWLDLVHDRHPDFFSLLLWVLIVVLVAIFVHGAWVMAQTLRAAGAPAGARDPESPEVRGAAWYRREALRLARLNRYPDAMQADFIALVLELDQRHLLRFHPSKTPREYTNEAKLADPSQTAFRDLVRALYGYAFARQPCGPDEFAAWHEHTLVERYAGAN
jgi:Domain of unknown function (DUF4129)